MKSLLKKIKTEKRKRNKNYDKIMIEIEIENMIEKESVKIKYVNNPNKIQSALKELNKTHVVNKNLHEIKHEILLDYTGVFEMVGYLKVGDQISEAHTRFRNIADYEAYTKSIDKGYDAEHAIFNS